MALHLVEWELLTTTLTKEGPYGCYHGGAGGVGFDGRRGGRSVGRPQRGGGEGSGGGAPGGGAGGGVAVGGQEVGVRGEQPPLPLRGHPEVRGAPAPDAGVAPGAADLRAGVLPLRRLRGRVAALRRAGGAGGGARDGGAGEGGGAAGGPRPLRPGGPTPARLDRPAPGRPHRAAAGGAGGGGGGGAGGVRRVGGAGGGQDVGGPGGGGRAGPAVRGGGRGDGPPRGLERGQVRHLLLGHRAEARRAEARPRGAGGAGGAVRGAVRGGGGLRRLRLGPGLPLRAGGGQGGGASGGRGGVDLGPRRPDPGGGGGAEGDVRHRLVPRHGARLGVRQGPARRGVGRDRGVGQRVRDAAVGGEVPARAGTAGRGTIPHPLPAPAGRPGATGHLPGQPGRPTRLRPLPRRRLRHRLRPRRGRLQARGGGANEAVGNDLVRRRSAADALPPHRLLERLVGPALGRTPARRLKIHLLW